MAIVKTYIGQTGSKVESAGRPVLYCNRTSWLSAYDLTLAEGTHARELGSRLSWRSRVGWRVAPQVIHFVAKVAWRLRIDYGNGFPDPPFVIAANHHSFLDPPIVGATYRRRLRFLTLIDLFGNYRSLDLALRTFEVIKVRRGVIPFGALRQALDHLGDGGVVAVFPEGTRAWRFGDKPIAIGAAWLAVRAKVPLVPIAIAGTEQVLGVDNKLRRGRIRAFVGPALYPDGTGRSAAEELTRRWADWVGSRLRSSAKPNAI
ncbi:MAG: lysophospholipid acyltransferase family protein [Acidimicrobiia bacterium]